MLNSEIVAILFRIINFFAFAALMVYVFKVYVLPGIKGALAAKIDDMDKLKVDQSIMHEKLAQLHLDAQAQEMLSFKLKKNIGIWREFQDRIDTHRAIKAGALRQSLEARIARKNEQIALMNIYKSLAPQAMVRAREALKVRFRDESEGRKYLVALFNKMGE